jgi:hypothetical protein
VSVQSVVFEVYSVCPAGEIPNARKGKKTLVIGNSYRMRGVNRVKNRQKGVVGVKKWCSGGSGFAGRYGWGRVAGCDAYHLVVDEAPIIARGNSPAFL